MHRPRPFLHGTTQPRHRPLAATARVGAPASLPPAPLSNFLSPAAHDSVAARATGCRFFLAGATTTAAAAAGGGVTAAVPTPRPQRAAAAAAAAAAARAAALQAVWPRPREGAEGPHPQRPLPALTRVSLVRRRPAERRRASVCRCVLRTPRVLRALCGTLMCSRCMCVRRGRRENGEGGGREGGDSDGAPVVRPPPRPASARTARRPRGATGHPRRWPAHAHADARAACPRDCPPRARSALPLRWGRLRAAGAAPVGAAHAGASGRVRGAGVRGARRDCGARVVRSMSMARLLWCQR